MTPRPRSEVLAWLNRRDNRDYPPPCCDKCAAAQKLVVIAECEFESAEMERAAAKHLVEVAHRKHAQAKEWHRDANRTALVACCMFSVSCVFAAAGYAAWSAAWAAWQLWFHFS